jgi:hypothetical protein
LTNEENLKLSLLFMSKTRKRDIHEELHKIDKDREKLHKKGIIKKTKKLWLLHMIQNPYIYYKAYMYHWTNWWSKIQKCGIIFSNFICFDVQILCEMSKGNLNSPFGMNLLKLPITLKWIMRTELLLKTK